MASPAWPAPMTTASICSGMCSPFFNRPGDSGNALMEGNMAQRSHFRYVAQSRFPDLSRQRGACCRRTACQDCRSEEHTSELQSRSDLVCRLLLEKKKKKKIVLSSEKKKKQKKRKKKK